MIKVVDAGLLRDVASMKPSAPPRRGSNAGTGGGEFDLPRWIESHEIPVRREGIWNGTGYKWVLEACPWNGHADNAPFIVRWPDGTIGAGCHHNSCQGYGWQELREHYEPGCYAVKSRINDADPRRTDQSVWSESTGSSLPDVPPFPLEALPRTLRRLVEEASVAIGCPPEFIAVPMLTTLGAAIGNSRVLVVKRGWTESALLYTVIVGDPGDKKSPALEIATAPAWDKQAELKLCYDEAMERYGCEQEQEEAEGDDEAHDPAEEPTLRRTTVVNTTVEALVALHADNLRGLLSSNDELSGWVRQMDQYKGRGSDRQFWLSNWGNRPWVQDRKKETFVIPRVFVALTGAIQPEILPEIKNNREDGLMDRILVSFPDAVPSRWRDDEISEEAMADYKKIYDDLFALEMDLDDNGNPEPRRVTFTPSAKQTFIDAVNALAEEREQPEFPDYFKGPWSKMEAYLARLSLVLAMVHAKQARSRSTGVSGEVMNSDPIVGQRAVEASVALIEYFKAHARRVYATLGDSRKEDSKTGKNLLPTVKWFLKAEGGHWEGMTHELFNIFKENSVSGLPGGVGPFGKLLRKIANDPDNDLVLKEGWRGNQPILMLSLRTELDSTGGTNELIER
jgi:hypothetical protein